MFKVPKTILFVLLLPSFLHSQTIVDAEYFFDSDPGVGNGTALTITPGDSVVLSQDISAAGLSPGHHTVFVRFKYDLGQWSLSEGRPFFIHSTPPPESPPISAAEYFFDADPGVGSGAALTVTPGDSVELSGDISSAGLIPGHHTLFVRFKDDSSDWGLSEGRPFFIHSESPVGPPLIALEYFFDTDPGFGSGMAFSVTPGDSIVIDDSISIAGLDIGSHQMVVRAMNADSTWGLYEAREFLVGRFNYPPLVQNAVADIIFPEDSLYSGIDLHTVFRDPNPEDSLRYAVSGNVKLSILIDSLAIVTILPDSNWFGDETLYFTATDDSAASATDTVLVTVTPVNDAPAHFEMVHPPDQETVDSLIISFSWHPSIDVDQDTVEYILYLVGPELDSTIAGLLDTSLTFDGFHLQPDTLYTWYVEATDRIDTTASTSQYQFRTPVDLTPPAAPQNLVAQAGDRQVTLTWHQNTEADFLRYRIYGGTTAAPTTPVDSINSTIDTTTNISGLTNGTTYYFQVTAVDTNYNESNFSNEVGATPSAPVSITNRNLGIPAEFALHQNYPNPFNPTTTIQFDLPMTTDIHIVVYDLLSREVVRLVDRRLEAGYHQMVWNGRDRSGRELPTGMYIARMVTPAYAKSIKMVLLK